MQDQGRALRTFGRGIIVCAIALLVVGTAIFPGTAAQTQQPKVPPLKISPDFPFESKFIIVLGSKLHYIDEGKGDPILFLHGNPTSSYLWRNVIPYLKPHGRVIAVDNIGFGKSDKPDIAYTYADHIRYIEGFINALNLKNITLIIHDWGSAMGFDYASRHESNVKGIAFMESMLPPAFPITSLKAVSPERRRFFMTLRDPVKGPEMVIKENWFVEVALPRSVVRDLSEAEMTVYRAPFVNPASRKPILVWPNEIPIEGKPANTTKIGQSYGKWLMQTNLPKLHVYATPGRINPPRLVSSLTKLFKNYETAFVGQGLHFIQEDHPEAIGRAIADWLRRISK